MREMFLGQFVVLHLFLWLAQSSYSLRFYERIILRNNHNEAATGQADAGYLYPADWHVVMGRVAVAMWKQ